MVAGIDGRVAVMDIGVVVTTVMRGVIDEAGLVKDIRVTGMLTGSRWFDCCWILATDILAMEDGMADVVMGKRVVVLNVTADMVTLGGLVLGAASTTDLGIGTVGNDTAIVVRGIPTAGVVAVATA